MRKRAGSFSGDLANSRAPSFLYLFTLYDAANSKRAARARVRRVMQPDEYGLSMPEQNCANSWRIASSLLLTLVRSRGGAETTPDNFLFLILFFALKLSFFFLNVELSGHLRC